jgi:hypothetical protein
MTLLCSLLKPFIHLLTHSLTYFFTSSLPTHTVMSARSTKKLPRLSIWRCRGLLRSAFPVPVSLTLVNSAGPSLSHSRPSSLPRRLPDRSWTAESPFPSVSRSTMSCAITLPWSRRKNRYVTTHERYMQKQTKNNLSWSYQVRHDCTPLPLLLFYFFVGRQQLVSHS